LYPDLRLDWGEFCAIDEKLETMAKKGFNDDVLRYIVDIDKLVVGDGKKMPAAP
jgi:hypothetical protein